MKTCMRSYLCEKKGFLYLLCLILFSTGELMTSSEHERDYDWFYLKHLQSIHADGAWYLNQRFIGKGGNGTTFFVTCTSGPNSGVQFALKVFHKISDERRRKRFLEEVRHYRALAHPSIIRVYDEGTFRAGEREYPFAVVDFLPTSLEERLGVGSPQITRLEAIRYVLNVASGVHYLHNQPNPIIHRDIKPANILVSGPTARLGDLGLAKVLMGNGDENTQDVQGYIAMPRFYRTPELVLLAREEDVALTVASDVYQLGLVLYRSISGFNPQKPPKRDALEDIELDLREIPGSGGKHLSDLIAEMLQEDAARRPSAEEVVRRLIQVHQEVCRADLEATGMMR
jgi:eukaryotic-like serine/threonine-protein kinase